MTPFLEFLRASAPMTFDKFVWPMLWQSSLLIGVLLLLDRLLRHRLRSAIRYGLWLVVLLKLLLPPSLALPTSLAWWIRPAAAPANAVRHTSVVVTYGPPTAGGATAPAAAGLLPPAAPNLPLSAWALLSSTAVSAGLLGMMLVRWRQIARMATEASPAPPALTEVLEKASRRTGASRRIRLRLTDRRMSPALCGFLRPVILLPRALAETLPPNQLEAVLVHELIHLRRRDIWVNALQALLQAAYWWHPLVWLANGRIRCLREQAVDDAVMLALRDEAVTYAPTLLEVARHALARRLSGLGLVGIFESRTPLRERILRLEEFQAPRTARLTLVSAVAIVGFIAVALPMGQAPAQAPQAQPNVAGNPTNFPYVGRLRSGEDNSDILARKAKALYEAGEINEAETMLQEAVQKNPRNNAAHYYLNVIAEARYKARRSQDEGAVRLQHPFLVQTNPFPSSVDHRRVIYGKLDSLRFGTISFDHLPLYAVVAKLNDQVQQLDPDKQGISFILDSHTKPNASNATASPSTGSNTPPTPRNDPDDIGQMPITILPALTDVRLIDVLDAVVKVAERPVRYSIQDYGVVLSEKGTNEPTPLYVRIIKVDPTTLSNSLVPVGGRSFSPRKPEDIQSAIRDYFAKQGANFGPPKSIFFNDREDTLVVRATLQDLDLIETLVALNVKLPHILIQAKFFEVTRPSTTRIWPKLGFDDPGKETLVKVLSPQQVLILSRTVESDTNFDLLSESKVETLPGRQAEMQVVDAMTVVTGIDPKALTPPGVPGNDVPYVTTNLTFGPTIDLVPYLSQDPSKVELTAVAFLCEFLGYEKPDQQVLVYVGGKTASAIKPLPHFRVRKLTTPERMPVPSGHSVLLANPVDENGRPAEADRTVSKSLFVLITPTLVDPAGNPITK